MKNGQRNNDLLSEVHGLTLHDVRMMRHRVERAETARDAFGYTDAMRIGAEGISELIASVAFTASLVAFRRDGEKWRLDGVAADSTSGKMIISDLDAIREKILQFEDSSRTYMRRPEVSGRAKIVAATLILALDACTDELKSLLCAIASIRSIGDPQGDAMLKAEDHFDDPEVPIWGDLKNERVPFSSYSENLEFDFNAK